MFYELNIFILERMAPGTVSVIQRNTNDLFEVPVNNEERIYSTNVTVSSGLKIHHLNYKESIQVNNQLNFKKEFSFETSLENIEAEILEFTLKKRFVELDRSHQFLVLDFNIKNIASYDIENFVLQKEIKGIS